MFKSLNIKRVSALFLMLFTGVFSYGQNDLAVSWSAHTTGDTIEDDPFNGSFTVSNVGESVINAGDTIWYGYFVDGVKYDIALSPEAVSGEVLEDDLNPGEEFVVVNNFYWPLIGSGITIEFCAVVYGVGYESYTDDLYTGDDDTSNNTDCVYAILPEYTVGLEDAESNEEVSMKFSNQKLFINNKDDALSESAKIEIYNIDGRLVYTQSVVLGPGVNQASLPEFVSGAYIARLTSNSFEVSEKFVAN